MTECYTVYKIPVSLSHFCFLDSRKLRWLHCPVAERNIGHSDHWTWNGWAWLCHIFLYRARDTTHVSSPRVRVNFGPDCASGIKMKLRRVKLLALSEGKDGFLHKAKTDIIPHSHICSKGGVNMVWRSCKMHTENSNKLCCPNKRCSQLPKKY